MKKFLVLSVFFIFLISGSELSGQKIPDPIIKAFHKGDVEALSEYFNTRLQVNINEKEYTCSKAQAKEIMREFLNINKPSSFSIIFEGGKEDSSFSIGKLVTNNGNYRVNIFFRRFDGVYLIHLLKIDKDDKKFF